MESLEQGKSKESPGRDKEQGRLMKKKQEKRDWKRMKEKVKKKEEEIRVCR